MGQSFSSKPVAVRDAKRDYHESFRAAVPAQVPGYRPPPYQSWRVRQEDNQNLMLNLPEQRKPPKEIEIPASYKLWTEAFNKHRLSNLDKDSNAFQVRIKDSASRLKEIPDYQDTYKYYEAQRRINPPVSSHLQRTTNIRLNRFNEESKMYIEKEAFRPKSSLFSIIDVRNFLESKKKADDKIFSSERRLPELTPDIIKCINHAIDPNLNNQEAIVEIDGTPILRKDLFTLVGSNWLNDEIVNAYLALIVARGSRIGKKCFAFNTFFYPKVRDSGYASVKRWTRKVDIFSNCYLIVPVHLGNHWCLAFVNFINRTITYYDSLGGHANDCCDILLDYLRNESTDKRKQSFDDENWRLIEAYYDESIPQQKNYSDCGVFLCMYAEYLTRDAKLNFSQELMPYFRKKMIYELMTKRVME